MIRNLKQKDKNNWAKLYYGYADFYKVPINTGIIETFGDGLTMKVIM